MIATVSPTVECQLDSSRVVYCSLTETENFNDVSLKSLNITHPMKILFSFYSLFS